MNKYIKKREGIDDRIDIDCWNRYFMELLGKAKERKTVEVKKKKKRERRIEREKKRKC